MAAEASEPVTAAAVAEHEAVLSRDPRGGYVVSCSCGFSIGLLVFAVAENVLRGHVAEPAR